MQTYSGWYLHTLQSSGSPWTLRFYKVFGIIFTILTVKTRQQMESCSVSNVRKEWEFHLWFEDEGSVWPTAAKLFFPKSSLLYLEEGRTTPNLWSFDSRASVLYFITTPLLPSQKHKPTTNLQEPSPHTPEGCFLL